MTDVFFEKMMNGETALPMHQHTNHLPIHPEVIRRMKEVVESQEWVYYGGPTGSQDVKAVIAKDLNVDLNKYEILLTNGCIEAMYMIMNQCYNEWSSFIDCMPSWPWPRLFMSAFNVPIKTVNLRKIQPSDITPNSCTNLLNGQHPQSLWYTDDELIAIAEQANKNSAWIIHDMTYRDFFPDYTNLLDYNSDRNFVVFSFSKANGFAGMRIGGLVCTKENAKRFFPLNPARLGVNVIAEKAVITSIETKHLWKQKNIDTIHNNNRRIYDRLHDLEARGILTMPKKDILSDVWIDFHDVSSTWVMEELLKRKVRINDTATTAYEKRGERGANANHITVTTSVPEYWVDYFCDQMVDLFKNYDQ